jgi:hypothetical protein
MTAGRQLVTVADVNGCALCGLAEGRHPVLGLGHMDDVAHGVTTTKDFVVPSANLLGARIRRRQSGGFPLAEIDGTTGEPRTSLVVATCRCGATAVATLNQAPTARCSVCILADVS